MQVLPELVTGGVERGTIDVALAQQAAGFRALVCSQGGPMVRELEDAGVEHFELPLATKNPLKIAWNNRNRLVSIIEAEGVDLVHARSRAPAWSAYRAAQITQTPFVTTFHGTYNFSNALKKYYNSVMTRGDIVIAISGFIRKHIECNYQMDASRIRVIPRGIDIDYYNTDAVTSERIRKLSNQWDLPEGGPIVMLPGRVTRWKGQLLLLRAVAELESGPVRCVIVGDHQGREAYVQEIRALAKELGLEQQVHLVGGCSDMPAALMLADVVVSASIDPEAFGRVAVEGQAMRRVVIAPDHGGASEQIIDGATGLLFKPGDVKDLTNKLERALSLSPRRREELGQAGQNNIRERFTKPSMCAATLAVYRELLDAKPQ